MVLLVIREAVEKCSNSLLEKETTFVKTPSRSVLAVPAARRQERKATATEITMIRRAKPSIFKPAIRR